MSDLGLADPARLLRLLALGDVAETPHPAEGPALDELRPRIAFEDAAVLELQQVETLLVGVGIQCLDLGQKSHRIRDLVQHEGQRLAVIAGVQNHLGQAPGLHKALIEIHDLSVGIYHQDPVRRGLQCRAQQ